MSELKKQNCCGGSCSSQSHEHKAHEANHTRQQLGGVTRPRVDILETESAYLLQVDMPGVDETTSEVLVEKDLLSIKGTTATFEPAGFEPVYRESGQRYYERLIRLPEEVEATKMEATVKNGVLKIRLPKSEKAQTIRVQVNAG